MLSLVENIKKQPAYSFPVGHLRFDQIFFQNLKNQTAPQARDSGLAFVQDYLLSHLCRPQLVQRIFYFFVKNLCWYFL